MSQGVRLLNSTCFCFLVKPCKFLYFACLNLVFGFFARRLKDAVMLQDAHLVTVWVISLLWLANSNLWHSDLKLPWVGKVRHFTSCLCKDKIWGKSNVFQTAWPLQESYQQGNHTGVNSRLNQSPFLSLFSYEKRLASSGVGPMIRQSWCSIGGLPRQTNLEKTGCFNFTTVWKGYLRGDFCSDQRRRQIQHCPRRRPHHGEIRRSFGTPGAQKWVKTWRRTQSRGFFTDSADSNLGLDAFNSISFLLSSSLCSFWLSFTCNFLWNESQYLCQPGVFRSRLVLFLRCPTESSVGSSREQQTNLSPKPVLLQLHKNEVNRIRIYWKGVAAIRDFPR